ncbi:DUF4435 domain-containing protein [Tenacibaculum sp.]|uniref:DUF4435 domain-containing protein n=1 Tax=Tenacibaculum sp. TaxID=1906242 RepID=UPI003AA856F6
MEEYITPERTANAILQDNSFKGYYLIVEGNKDIKFYGKFINNQCFRIRPAFGNEKVKKVLNILEDRGFNKRIGIIDSDFNKILENEINIDGLFITDDHDIEVMIIKTPALENVIRVFCSSAKIQKFEKENKTTIRESLLSIGKEIGYLKLANKIHDLGLVFKPKKVEGKLIKYSNFTCDKTLSFLGEEKLIDTVINYSRIKSPSMKPKADIKNSYTKLKEDDYDLNQLVNGHDLSNLLYLLMKKALKSRNKMLINNDSVEDSLILSYDYEYFKDTELYKSLKDWSDTKGLSLFN